MLVDDGGGGGGTDGTKVPPVTAGGGGGNDSNGAVLVDNGGKGTNGAVLVENEGGGNEIGTGREAGGVFFGCTIEFFGRVAAGGIGGAEGAMIDDGVITEDDAEDGNC